jgi:hypothetical protein
MGSSQDAEKIGDHGGVSALVFQYSERQRNRFQSAMENSGGDRARRESSADALANLALEVCGHYDKGGARRFGWGTLWKAGGALAAIVTAALGGTVLSVNSLPGWGRYTFAGVAFAAAALAALNPAQEWSADNWRHVEYGSLYRQIVSYIFIELPWSNVDALDKQLTVFETRYVAVRHSLSTAGPQRLS